MTVIPVGSLLPSALVLKLVLVFSGGHLNPAVTVGLLGEKLETVSLNAVGLLPATFNS